MPFLPALVPSERACRERGHRPKTLLNVGRQMALQVRRWLPGRDLLLVGDSAFSALLFLDTLHRGGITAITRLRVDAAIYDPAPPRPPGPIRRLEKTAVRGSLRCVISISLNQELISKLSRIFRYNIIQFDDYTLLNMQSVI